MMEQHLPNPLRNLFTPLGSGSGYESRYSATRSSKRPCRELEMLSHSDRMSTTFDFQLNKVYIVLLCNMVYCCGTVDNHLLSCILECSAFGSVHAVTHLTQVTCLA